MLINPNKISPFISLRLENQEFIMKNLIIASTSTLHGGEYLDYLLPHLQVLFKHCKTILFIPYARPDGISHEEYTTKAASVFAKINIKVKGIHEFDAPVWAVKNAEGIFTGGGNTFLLVSQLYQNKIMTVLSETIKKGTPYLGTSAGSNICGLTMQTTNDMPIIYPPSFQTGVGDIPYLNSDQNTTMPNGDFIYRMQFEKLKTKLESLKMFESLKKFVSSKKFASLK